MERLEFPSWLQKYRQFSVQWKHLSTNNEPPPPRAYHSMTCIGARYLLFGGFDGKTTFGDIWWLVPEDDPIARRPLPSPPNISSESKPTISNQSVQSILQVDVVDEVNDKELLELSTKLAREVLPTSYQSMSIQALRKHWKTCVPNSLQLHELSALLRDYQRLIINQHKRTLFSKSLPNASNHGNEIYCFFHVKNASQLRMSDIPKLLFEYQRLISS